MMKTYKFFWDGVYSNFYRSHFTDLAGTKYVSNEQYFMVMKALHFGDEDSAKKMLQLSDPNKIKQLGRKVKNFDSDDWDQVKLGYMYKGLKLKFTQDPELKQILLAETADLFVEASPYDKIWGIGLGEEKARFTPESEWPGQNLLGQLLTKLREELRS